MNDLFSASSGVGFSFWRLPMTSTDFNSTNTTWTDVDTAGRGGDPEQHFGLYADDTNFIVPTIKDELAINSSIKIVASPWSASAWMKSNDSMYGSTGGINAPCSVPTTRHGLTTSGTGSTPTKAKACPFSP